MEEINNMSNENKLQAIIDWQMDESIHPMTCGEDSNHRNLIGVLENGVICLKCLDCDYVQKFIPNIVYMKFLNK